MTKRRLLLALGVAGGGVLAALTLRNGLAEGIPPVNPLYYSGTLSEAGELVTDTRQITINLWRTPGSVTGETPLCNPTVSMTTLVAGRFRIALDATCKAAINANPTVYVEVVDGTTSLGRLKVGAVPFAVEADHATNADNVASAAYAGDAGHAASADLAATATAAQSAAGDLQTTITQLQSSVQELQQQVASLQAAPSSGLTVATEYGVPGDFWYDDCQNSVSVPTTNDSLPIQACARMASFKCVQLGYRDGWPQGNTDGTRVSITCVK